MIKLGKPLYLVVISNHLGIKNMDKNHFKIQMLAGETDLKKFFQDIKSLKKV